MSEFFRYTMLRIIAAAVLFFFTVNSTLGYAQSAAPVSLPAAGSMLALSASVVPPSLRGVKVYVNDPFRFDFILDAGDGSPVPNTGDETAPLRSTSDRLIKYFLAALTVPEKDLWVNLSPYEKDRIVPDAFGRTEMGRDLLAQDYLLKQLTASLIYPEGETGRKFWTEVYKKAQDKFGTTDIPIDTFNKVWIMPATAVVYESTSPAPGVETGIDGSSGGGAAYIVESRLKVMAETDYLATSNNALPSPQGLSVKATQVSTVADPAQDLARQVLREIVIPILEKEVNGGENFAPLRQVYQSLILAAWYKKKIKDGILAQVYTDKNKTAGVDITDPQEKEKIYQQYLEAFKKGVYNYVREEADPVTQETIPRKYFSGGMDCSMLMKEVLSSGKTLPKDTPGLRVIRARAAPLPPGSSGRDNVLSADAAMFFPFRKLVDQLQLFEYQGFLHEAKGFESRDTMAFFDLKTEGKTVGHLDLKWSFWRKRLIISKIGIMDQDERGGGYLRALLGKLHDLLPRGSRVMFVQVVNTKTLAYWIQRVALQQAGGAAFFNTPSGRTLVDIDRSLQQAGEDDSRDHLLGDLENFDRVHSALRAYMEWVSAHSEAGLLPLKDIASGKGFGKALLDAGFKGLRLEISRSGEISLSAEKQGDRAQAQAAEDLAGEPDWPRENPAGHLNILNRPMTDAEYARWIDKGTAGEGFSYAEAGWWYRAKMEDDIIMPKVGSPRNGWTGFWDNPVTARNYILVVLDTIGNTSDPGPDRKTFQELRQDSARPGNIKLMADLYRKHVLAYKGMNGSNGQIVFFRHHGLGAVMASVKAKPYLDKANSPAALVRFAFPELVDQSDPDALRVWEIEDGFWTEAYAKKEILTVLDGIRDDGPGEAGRPARSFGDLRREKNVAGMARLYREQVIRRGQVNFFNENDHLRSLMGSRCPFLEKAGSPAALLRFAVPEIVYARGPDGRELAEQKYPDALRTREIEDDFWTPQLAWQSVLDALDPLEDGAFGQARQAFQSGDPDGVGIMADIYRRQVMEYKAVDRARFQNGQYGFFDEKGRLAGLRMMKKAFLGGSSKVLGLLTHAVPEMLNPANKGALRLDEISRNGNGGQTAEASMDHAQAQDIDVEIRKRLKISRKSREVWIDLLALGKQKLGLPVGKTTTFGKMAEALGDPVTVSMLYSVIGHFGFGSGITGIAPQRGKGRRAINLVKVDEAVAALGLEKPGQEISFEDVRRRSGLSQSALSRLRRKELENRDIVFHDAKGVSAVLLEQRTRELAEQISQTPALSSTMIPKKVRDQFRQTALTEMGFLTPRAEAARRRTDLRAAVLTFLKSSSSEAPGYDLFSQTLRDLKREDVSPHALAEWSRRNPEAFVEDVEGFTERWQNFVDWELAPEGPVVERTGSWGDEEEAGSPQNAAGRQTTVFFQEWQELDRLRQRVAAGFGIPLDWAGAIVVRILYEKGKDRRKSPEVLIQQDLSELSAVEPQITDRVQKRLEGLIRMGRTYSSIEFRQAVDGLAMEILRDRTLSSNFRKFVAVKIVELASEFSPEAFRTETFMKAVRRIGMAEKSVRILSGEPVEKEKAAGGGRDQTPVAEVNGAEPARAAADLNDNARQGGIDLTSAAMNVETRNGGGEIRFTPDPALLEVLRGSPGFVPDIMDIEPMTDLKSFLEIR